MHPDRFADMQSRQQETVQQFPGLDPHYKGRQYIIYNKGDWRPFERGFDEDEFLEEFFKMARMPDAHGPPFTYATAVRYNLGNNHIMSLPIPTYIMHRTLQPIRMRPLVRRAKARRSRRSKARRSRRLR